jgi:SAM-dependent methyltransferase
LLQGNYILSHAAVMYRRPVLGDVGVFDPELTELSEYDLYLRIARQYPIGSHTARVVEDREYGRRAARATESLAAGLETLRRQEPFVAGDARRERALQLGTRRWRAHWGSPADAQPSGPAGRGPERKKGALRRRRPQQSPETTGPSTPAVGKATLGDLRRLTPVSDNFGFDRGRPVDRFYIEDFLDRRSSDVRGRVLEVQENHYTMRYGAERVTQSEVINLLPGNPRATIVGDLTDSQVLPANAFDCVILTQTISITYDFAGALDTACAALRPGGVLLLTVPGISHQAAPDGELFPDHWRFTWRAIERLLAERLGDEADVEVGAEGTVAACAAFLYGIPAAEIDPAHLDPHDPDYEMVIWARAVRPGSDGHPHAPSHR